MFAFSSRWSIRGRIAAVTLITALVPVSLEAQGLRLKGGPSFDNVAQNGASPGDAGRKTGFAAGVGIDLGGMVGVGAEALYARRSTSPELVTLGRDLTYVDIPVYLRVRLPLPLLSPFAYAGPQWSTEIGCEVDGNDCVETGRSKRSYAGVIGAGVRLGGISVEGRYVYGLEDLEFGTVSNAENYRSRSLLVLLGLGF